MIKLMSHMVAHYPDWDGAMAVAEGLVAGGSDYLEIQFPFSDPTADGPVIQAACQRALEAGFSVHDGFEFVSRVRSRLGVPVFLMSYASLVVSRGTEAFIRAGADAGVTGFILPDLPADSDEGAYDAAEKVGSTIMPVVVTTMNPARLDMLRDRSVDYVYVALRRGITGNKTSIGSENLAFLDHVNEIGAKVMAGFGITTNAQVRALESHVYAAIVGTALVRTVTDVVERGSTTRNDELTRRLSEQVVSLIA